MLEVKSQERISSVEYVTSVQVVGSALKISRREECQDTHSCSGEFARHLLLLCYCRDCRANTMLHKYLGKWSLFLQPKIAQAKNCVWCCTEAEE